MSMDVPWRRLLSDVKAIVMTALFRAGLPMVLSWVLRNPRCLNGWPRDSSRPCIGALCHGSRSAWWRACHACQAVYRTAVLLLCHRTTHRAAYYPQPLSTVTKRWPQWAPGQGGEAFTEMQTQLHWEICLAEFSALWTFLLTSELPPGMLSSQTVFI